MSGTANQIPPIPIRFDGAENVQRTIDAIVARIGTLETAATRSSQSFGTLRTQAEQTGSAFRNTGQIIGQAGYQVQDFAVQIAGGQSALTAFIQQGSQLAGVFGPTGIIAGAVLAVAGLTAKFVDLKDVMRLVDQSFYDAQRATAAYGEATDRLTQAIENNAQAEARRRREREAGLLSSTIASRNEIAEELRRAEERLRRMDDARAANAETDRLARAAGLPQVMDTGREVPGEYERVAGDVARLRSQYEGLATQFRIASTPDPRGDESGPDRGDYWSARNEFARQQAANDAAELAPIWQAIQGQYRDYVGTLSPTGGGSGSGRDPRQYGPLDGSRQGLMQLERGRIQYQEEMSRALERSAREEERLNDRREDANRRVTDNIVNYASDSFATLFDENGRGFEGMLETFEQTAKRTFARIAAEAIIRPVVEPIVSGLGLGSLGSGNGGFSGLFGSSGGGSSAVSTFQSQNGRSLFSGLGGYISNPIWQPGMGFFAPDVSGLNAASSAMPWMVPSVPGTGGGGILGRLGSSSLGQYAAGIGGGYLAGSTLGTYLAGQSQARQQNAQFGAGGGAAAGAIAGTLIAPGIGTVIGGLIGGLAGGAGGGLIGPGKGFSGGDVGVAVDANGYLTLGASGGKNWNGGASRDQTAAGLASINDLLRGAGVSLNGLQGAQLGYQGYGGSGNVFGPTEIWRAVRGNLTTSNSTLAAALGQPWMQSFEDLQTIAPFAAQNDNLTRAVGSGGIRSRDDFNSAAEWITSTYEPLLKAASVTDRFAEAIAAQNKVYDDAIAKARELGLAETGLWEAREKTRLETLEARNFAVGNATAALRVDELRATGAAGDARRASLLEFDIAGRQRTDQLSRFLEDNGIIEGSSFYGSTMGRLSTLLRTQRQDLIDQQRAQREADLAQRQDALGNVRDAVMGLRIGELQANGSPAALRRAQLLQFDVGARQQRESLLGTLRSAGFDDDSQRSETLLDRLNDLLARQRGQIGQIGQTPDGANSGTELLQNLLVGEAGGLSGQARYAAGVATLGNLRRSGNLDAYTSFASQFVGMARGYLGTSERFGDLTSQIKRDTVALGGDPTGLLRSIDVQTRTADGVERFVAGQAVTNDELRALRREMARLSAQVVTLQQRRAS